MIYEPGAQPSAPNGARSFQDLYAWVLSLPWVVERPLTVGPHGARSFAVDCKPLGRQRLWLIMGPRNDGVDLGVILPVDVAIAAEEVGIGRRAVPMPANHVLFKARDDASARPLELEGLVLSAYSYAMS